MSKEYKITFLGTGAADYDWSKIGEPGVRGSAGTLLNGNILFDYGATGRENLSRFGVQPDDLDVLLFTHSHSDHFNAEKVKALLTERQKKTPLEICGDAVVINELAGAENCNLHILEPGETFRFGDFTFTALAANHMIEAHPEEKTLHYLVETADKTMLYATDGAGFTKPEWLIIREHRLDLIIIDATMAEPGNWRIFEHNDLDVIDHICRTLRAEKIIGPQSRIVLTHLARTLWPEDPAVIDRIARGYGFEAAYDGMLITL
ncbi:MAG: MBL fold metallo-hydrolase [Lentisphaeria bacterium]|nr:MBL fold metallo-hydrolase [Lentisphaeria bacterium]